MRSSAGVAPTRVIVAIVVPVVIGFVLAALFLVDQVQRAQLHTDVSVRSSVASAVTQIRTEIRNEASALAAGPVPGDKLVSLSKVGKAPISPIGATNARDSGAAVFDDAATPPSIVVAVYRPGSAPQTTAARRAALIGYRVVAFSLKPTLAALVVGNGGFLVRGPTQVIAAYPGSVPSGSRTFGVDMALSDAPGFVVEGWLPAPGVPGFAWFGAVGFVILFGLIAAAFAILVRRDLAAAAARQQVERDRALVTGLAPVLQASLDIGEVVPAAASHLAQGLVLAGLSLSSAGDAGDRQLFSWGTTPDAAVRPIISVPERLETGQTFAVSLTRGGRVLGVLRVVADAPLERNDLVALTTASELLGSTLANAESFTRQQELVERMRSVDELKTVFLATASHELRTPVTAIVGFSALVLEHWETMNPPQTRGLVERVLANGRKLETLIEQLLDFSQLERGLPRTSIEFLDLGATVAGILAEQPELTGRHELITDLGPGCSVRGSASAVERIVNNLVGNAAKYAPSGTRITVTVRGEGDRALLLVDDEGPGVPEADRERVFSRFYRGRGDSVTRTSGAGIGLAIVAEYTASMAGIATVEQAPTGGARFSVSFPAVVVAAEMAVRGASDVALS